MARMRSIKPEFWADQDLTRLPRDIRLLYIALWNHCDEQARMQGDARLVKSWCFPLDDDVTAAVIDGWLSRLQAAGKLVRYSVNGSQYLHLPTLAGHQKLDPRLDSRLPAPPDPDSSKVNTDESVRTDVENTDPPQPEGARARVRAGASHVAGGMEHVAGSRGQETRARGARLPDHWKPPPELVDWGKDQGYSLQQQHAEHAKFVDYWRAQPGAKGRKTDWEATWRNWLRNSRASPNGTRSTTDDRVAQGLALARQLREQEPKGITGGPETHAS